MSNLIDSDLTNFVEENIVKPFYLSRARSLQKIRLKDLLGRKNPYLFRAKNIKTGQDLVKEMLDAFLSSSEETIFGNLLERLAVYACERKFMGFKPKEGEFRSIDLIFNRENKTYIVGIKSGNHWGNSDSTTMMISNLKKTSLERYTNQEVVLVSGICYGMSKISQHENYVKYQGQAFWELVSGEKKFYIDIVKPLGDSIKNRDIEFNENYIKKVNEMTAEILNDFCTENQLDWEKIVEFNCGNNQKVIDE